MHPIGEDLCPEVRREYERWKVQVGPDDPYAGPDTLGIHDVLRAHFLIADFFYREGEGIGGIGPRNLDLLHSAVARQTMSLGWKRKWTDKFDVCATLLFGLVKNHPFHDANKRTAFLCTLLYLYRQGRITSALHKEFEDFIVDVADNALAKYARYQDLVKDGNKDADVIMISKYLRSKTRELDKRTYTITFKDLDRILRRHGYEMINPDKNSIDIVRVEHRSAGWFRKESVRRQKIMSLGFPGWTRQVAKGDIKAVRQATGLTHERGVDSQAFFNGVEDLHTLIVHYQEPLKRLAQR